MLQSFYKILDNFFSDPRITPTRFRNFCRFVLNAMKADNTDGKYDDDMVKIQAVIDALNKELKDIHSGVINKVNSTSQVDEFIYDFGQFMKNTAGAIAYALGGTATPAFYEFYLYKNEEYLNATKTTMPGLSLRVFDAATKYAKELGTRLTADLQSFAAGYETVLEKQQAQMTNVTTDRKDRDTAFVDGQWTLTGIVLDVAKLNIRNPEQSKKLFPFAMLFPQSKSFIVKADGKLAAKESKEISNRFMNNKVMVTIYNTSLNADAIAWLGMSPTEDAPATAVVIKANGKTTVKATDLGDLAGTFLMIRNMSDLNEVSYAIEITGLKKTKEEKAAEAKAKADAENMEVVTADSIAS